MKPKSPAKLRDIQVPSIVMVKFFFNLMNQRSGVPDGFDTPKDPDQTVTGRH